MMIRIENLKKKYENHEVLKGISIEVGKGEIYGFIGQNGAGKSTTMNILAGLISYDEGKCFVNSKQVNTKSIRMFKEIGYLPEDPKFYPYMNSREYLDFIGTMGGDSKEKIKERSIELLEMVKLNKAAKRPVGGYSRGMKQRLGIAVAMYHDPELLLLDEPSSALDPEGRKDVVDIIMQLKKQGKTIFLSTHILNDVERVCDRVAILQGGEIVLEENLEVLHRKYVKPVYDIEFETMPDDEAIKKIKSKDFAEKITIKQNIISIYLKSLNGERIELLKEIAGIGLPVISLNLRKSNLEDIFLKVVNNDE